MLEGGSIFQMSEQNFTVWPSPKIWCNFSKICIYINKNLKSYWEIFLEIHIWIFCARKKFFARIFAGKNHIYYVLCYNSRSGAGRAPSPGARNILKKFIEIFHIHLPKFNQFFKKWSFLHRFEEFIRIIANSIRRGGSGAYRSDADESFWYFPKFSHCHFNFFFKLGGECPGPRQII